MIKNIKLSYLKIFIIFCMLSVFSFSAIDVGNEIRLNTNIVKIVNNNDTINKYSEIEVKEYNKKSKKISKMNTDNKNIASPYELVETVSNVLFANAIVISNQVGAKITTIIGVFILAMFILDVGKMMLTSQLTQVSIGATLSQYFSRLLTLGLVSALLLIPIPRALRDNGVENLFQYIINRMMNLWLHLGQMFFPDSVYPRLITHSDVIISTASGPYAFRAGDALPGKIVAELINIPLSTIQTGIWKIASLWTFFSGLIFVIVGIYILFKCVGLVSIYISSVFEFIILLTLSSIYLPFLLLESTKDRIGNKPLELLLTQGIKLVVTTGLVGMMSSLFSEGSLRIDTGSIITIFMIAVAFSIMEKIVNNNSQIASTILQGGGLGVSSGNEFFAIGGQIGMIAGGAAMIGANGAIGLVSETKNNMANGDSFGDAMGKAFKYSSLGSEFGKLKNAGESIGNTFKDISKGVKMGDAKNKNNLVRKSKNAKIDADRYSSKAKHTAPLENALTAMYMMAGLTGNQQLAAMSNMMLQSFSSDAYKQSANDSIKASESFESMANHIGNSNNSNNMNFEASNTTPNNNTSNTYTGNNNSAPINENISFERTNPNSDVRVKSSPSMGSGSSSSVNIENEV